MPDPSTNYAGRRRKVAMARARTVKRQHGGGQRRARLRTVPNRRRWERRDEIYVDRSILWTVWLSPAQVERRQRAQLEE